MRWSATCSKWRASRAALVRHPIDVQVPRDLPLVEFDATLVERVLYNLIENASKYTPAGTLITVAAETSAGELVVSVTDAGAGIPAGQEKSIFEKFTRGVRESATPGVGLGLAISRAIIDAHHGRIWVTPGAEFGSVFEFVLPARDARSDPAE